MNIAEFKSHMDRIARKNNDVFKVQITEDELGHCLTVLETADGHTFLEVFGHETSDCIEQAIAELPDAMEAWGYKP